MELKQIKELMASMERAGIKKLTIKEKTGYELHLERQDEHPPQHAQPPMHMAYPPVFHSPMREVENAPRQAPPAHRPHAEEPKEQKSEKEGSYVTSPMVGTFYASSSPDDPAFVKVGDRVEANTVICIIEAMKVMNEVKAGVSGVVAEVLVQNAHPVEFGTKILRIV